MATCSQEPRPLGRWGPGQCAAGGQPACMPLAQENPMSPWEVTVPAGESDQQGSWELDGGGCL